MLTTIPTPTMTSETRSSSVSPTETENGTTMLTTTPGSAHSSHTHEEEACRNGDVASSTILTNISKLTGECQVNSSQ